MPLAAKAESAMQCFRQLLGGTSNQAESLILCMQALLFKSRNTRRSPCRGFAIHAFAGPLNVSPQQMRVPFGPFVVICTRDEKCTKLAALSLQQQHSRTMEARSPQSSPASPCLACRPTAPAHWRQSAQCDKRRAGAMGTMWNGHKVLRCSCAVDAQVPRLGRSCQGELPQPSTGRGHDSAPTTPIGATALVWGTCPCWQVIVAGLGRH